MYLLVFASYTVPLVKSNYIVLSGSLRVQDFRGISISSVLSKIFEYYILNRFANFLTSSDNQFGFKKKIGCVLAIFSMRRVIERYTINGSTVNICALDPTMAFDKIFIKLMKRNIPVQLLAIIEYWLSSGYTCVRWASRVSCFFKTRLRSSSSLGVLSPCLFAIFIDDIIINVVYLDSGYHVNRACVSIIILKMLTVYYYWCHLSNPCKS